MFWQHGDIKLLRHVRLGRVLYAIPMIVVEDAADWTVLYLREGTRVKWSYVNFDDGSIDGPKDKVWEMTNVLQIIETDASHATWSMWSAQTGDFLCWYVNLQDRAIRVSDGLISWDQSLDIVVSPNLDWMWKDEDHFERIQALGWLTKVEATAIRREGERVIARIDNREPPFGEPWPDWRPDDGWGIPDLPSNWAEIPST
jgi:hypothetical protein